MTVGELKEKLNSFPDDTRVVTPGFDEGGLDDVEHVKSVCVRFQDENIRGHYGQHEEINPPSDEGVLAVLINF